MKYYLRVYGCQMNKSDGERIAAVLENAGWQACDKEKDADLIMVIACSVRQSAVDRIYGKTAKYAMYKKENPRLKTVLTGCILDFDKKKLSEKFDYIINIANIKIIPSLVIPTDSERATQHEEEWRDPFQLNELSTQKEIPPLRSPSSLGLASVGMTPSANSAYSYLSITPKYSSPSLSYIPIMTGCDNFCSYCVVPYTRGREYSRPASEILTEVKNLIKKNYKEITLIGQNVNSYISGSSLYEGDIINFPALLRLINSIPGDFWMRFATSHPKDMSDELINAMAECEKVVPYIHLPVQSGSDKILKMMNRKYTKKHYLGLIKKIKKKIPDAMFSTDVIVGFPGETKKDFMETADVFKKVKFNMAYIARYSPRAGTAAFGIKDNVSMEEKAERENKLTEILKQTALENNKKFIGKTVRVLIERRDKDGYIGKTAHFINVKIFPVRDNPRCHPRRIRGANIKLSTDENSRKQDKTLTIGRFKDVKITKTAPFGMEGELG